MQSILEEKKLVNTLSASHTLGDIKGTSVVRGKSVNLATALRKNKGRVTKNKRNMGHRNDWILRLTGNDDCAEYGIGEGGKMWTDEFGTKFLTEMCIKTPKALKDMLLKLIKMVNWNNELRSKLQTIGIVHSGLMMVVIYMDNPRGYICRVRRGDLLEVPDEEENIQAVLMVLAAMLNIK